MRRAGTYRLRHFGDFKHILGGSSPFNGTSGNFEVHGVDVEPHKHHKKDNSRRFELSDWERYVREHGFLIPVLLFALLLVGTALYRQAVSRRPAVSPHPYQQLEVAP